jgi:DNA-binding beta-propeller fold protein YncE
VLAAVAVCAILGAGAASGVPAGVPPQVRHLEYVVVDGTISVYDIDHGNAFVRQIPLPQARGVRGVGVSTRDSTLFVSYGGDGGNNGNGSLLCYDLRSDRVLWTRSYGTGVDSFALSRDGGTIYLPTGELSRGDEWLVIDARTGDRIATIHGGRGPHNTVVGVSGKFVYLGGRIDKYLYVARTSDNRIVRRVGPLKQDVRPFTVNGRGTLAFTTASAFLGFQMSSLTTGKLLYTVGVRRFTFDPATFKPSTPSHGISLSPNERELYLIDAANSYVHVFDVSRGARAKPRLVANIALPDKLVGEESPCSNDCQRDGWLQHSRDGRYVYVGDSGDVIDTRTRRVTAFLAPLRETRKMLEIDWRGDRVVSTTSRSGIGYVTR